MSPSQGVLVFVVVAPGAIFGVLALLWLLGWVPSERVVSRITRLTFSACVLGLGVLVWKLASNGGTAVVVTFGNWFSVHDYRFPLVLLADRLSTPFLAITVVLSGLIGQFSATYLHRERGFFRFFLLLHLFAFGSLLAFAAGSFDLLRSKTVCVSSRCIAPATSDCWWASSPCITGLERPRLTPAFPCSVGRVR